ncbi:MAG: aconitate hydratase [candidate division Zixibacteria bacterium]|nr:aconitate hydratase [candidate division Zixibacteria bacterium]NIR68033.1 aconitate hydratase [candidate division Zixibacteria bacterium]NIS17542.1 aconitate hydratase [candidate division Zixibacteria bacterium]NIS49248.1 aconitate hydratase [candidate division Zixibacteria bacterium]NIT53845.1 aconitate hydratase [candidate division Zixibacteria bacterium]
MKKNVAQKLIESHLVSGEMKQGTEIGLRIDQTLTQDATGTMVMLELEAMNLDRVKTELSAQYVDHNLLQTDFKNADDHLFLRSACQKFGVWYSRPGNGVSHPVHMERFGIPGKTLLGSDSHTCAAGSLGMLAMGAGGLEVATAMAGDPYHIKMPGIMGVKLTGKLPDWVSAKDVILEMLRRHGVSGGVGKIVEYYGPGLESLSAMDRHVIANMGAELGATTTVFPSDEMIKKFLKQQERADVWTEILADEGAEYDEHDEIDLSSLEPLIAKPTSPGNVVPVKEVAGKDIYQAMVGSSANPGFRDFAIAAMIVDGKQVHDRVSFDINPTSRQITENLIELGYLSKLVRSGGRVHQPGCNGCIGMGQAPATGRISLRTVPRNFPGRSGTKEDAVYLCSPETAAASALTGKITDPRELDMDYPKYEEPDKIKINTSMLLAPAEKNEDVELEKGPNIKTLPELDPIPNDIEGPVLMKTGDDVSTDEIMPAGTKVLPLRSNVPEISKFTFAQIDEDYYKRAMEHKDSGSFVVGGSNYGQGSSREHAVLGPRYLGVKVVLAKSFARIHWQNLVNFGIVPLTFINSDDYDKIEQGDELIFKNIRESIQNDSEIEVENKTKGLKFKATHNMSDRQVEMILKGSLINIFREKHIA